MGHGASPPRVFAFFSPSLKSLKSLKSLSYNWNADATDELRSARIPADNCMGYGDWGWVSRPLVFASPVFSPFLSSP
jgi:hypothetical protein